MRTCNYSMVETTGGYLALLLRQIGLNCSMIDVVELKTAWLDTGNRSGKALTNYFSLSRDSLALLIKTRIVCIFQVTLLRKAMRRRGLAYWPTMSPTHPQVNIDNNLSLIIIRYLWGSIYSAKSSQMMNNYYSDTFYFITWLHLMI